MFHVSRKFHPTGLGCNVRLSWKTPIPTVCTWGKTYTTIDLARFHVGSCINGRQGQNCVVHAQERVCRWGGVHARSINLHRRVTEQYWKELWQATEWWQGNYLIWIYSTTCMHTNHTNPQNSTQTQHTPPGSLAYFIFLGTERWNTK